MFIRLSRVLLFTMGVFLSFFSVAFAGNIENSNSTANLEIDNSDVFFACDGCDVEVSDTEINGLIWGETLGWVNLQPAGGGVFNTRYGVVSGNAWGSISGWVDFLDVFIDTETGEFSGEAFSQNRGPITFQCPGSSCVVTTWRPIGCTDLNASNYDETATVDDGSCEYSIKGCTDPSAINYNPNVESDDGTCIFDVEGCIDPAALNYNPQATLDDGSCNYTVEEEDPSDPPPPPPPLLGCIDPTAINYNPNAQSTDGSCQYECIGELCDGILGCLNPTALNYNPNANQSNNSCLYDIPGNGCTNQDASNYNPDAINDNGTCIFTINPNNPDNPNNPTEGEIFIDEILSNLPGGGGPALLVNRFIVTTSGLAGLVSFALLLASLLQTLPFREANFLFSYFSFYTTKKYWGTVYDSITKQPLDPAYVTLFDEAGQAMETSITDIDGRYNFIVSPGTYFLSAQKTDYQFPSKKLESKNYDELYTHLYFGGPLVVEHQDEVISRNIPMDPLRFNWNEYEKQKTKVTHFYRPWHRTLTFIAKGLFFIGFVVAIWVVAVAPSVFSFFILGLYLVTTVLKIIGFRKIPRGYVKDAKGFALRSAVIRVYSSDLNREVKHAIVGDGGHYLLLVPKGKYYMTIEQKLHDETYKQIHKTNSFRVRRGFIAKKITLNESFVGVEEDIFNQEFQIENKATSKK